MASVSYPAQKAGTGAGRGIDVGRQAGRAEVRGGGGGEGERGVRGGEGGG